MHHIFVLIKKALGRVWRCATGRVGAYGKIGHGNQFAGCRINEVAEVGNYNYFGPGCLIHFARVGNFCSFAPNAIIAPGEHNMMHASTSALICPDSLMKKRTVIGSDVWCGANTVILQGLTIGDGAVIGAGAVVTKDVPPYAIVTGIPARILRYRFSPEEIAAIQSSQWHQCDLREARALVSRLYESGQLNSPGNGGDLIC